MNIKPKLDRTYSFDQLIDRFLVSKDINRTWPSGHLLEFDLNDDCLIASVCQMYLELGFSLEESRVLSRNLTVYNPTAPFEQGGVRYILARVEPRDGCYSVVVLFRETLIDFDKKWQIVRGAEIFKYSEDPFCCGIIQGYFYFGMVRIGKIEKTTEIPHRTVIYRLRIGESDNLAEQFGKLEQFAAGPPSMKGIRFAALPSGEIALFKRPKAGVFGAGKITFKIISSIDQLPADLAVPAVPDEILKNLFMKEEWGGSNQVFVLKNGLIGILGHIAHIGKNNKKDYAAVSIIVDPASKIVLDLNIIATTYSFWGIASKTIHLHEIMYSGGLVREQTGKAMLYAGLGDTTAGCIEITDPFSVWENIN